MKTQSKSQQVRWVTNPHGRPHCPKHQTRMVAYAGHGRVGLVRCPVQGCDQRRKVAREQLDDRGGCR